MYHITQSTIKSNVSSFCNILYSLKTYLFTPWRSVLLEKLIGSQLVKKFPAFYGTRRFITAFTSARHLSLSWAGSVHPPHPTSWRSILIMSSHLRLGLPSGLFPSGFPTETLYTPLLPQMLLAPPLSFFTRTVMGEEYRSVSSSLCSFLHSPVNLWKLVYIKFMNIVLVLLLGYDESHTVYLFIGVNRVLFKCLGMTDVWLWIRTLDKWHVSKEVWTRFFVQGHTFLSYGISAQFTTLKCSNISVYIIDEC